MKSLGAPKRTKRKLIVFTLAAIFLTTLAWYFHNYVSLEELANQESRLREAIATNPWRSFAIGFCSQKATWIALAQQPRSGAL
jgi:Tfp pilus assembly protein PilO